MTKNVWCLKYLRMWMLKILRELLVHSPHTNNRPPQRFSYSKTPVHSPFAFLYFSLTFRTLHCKSQQNFCHIVYIWLHLLTMDLWEFIVRRLSVHPILQCWVLGITNPVGWCSQKRWNPAEKGLGCWLSRLLWREEEELMTSQGSLPSHYSSSPHLQDLA